MNHHELARRAAEEIYSEWVTAGEWSERPIQSIIAAAIAEAVADVTAERDQLKRQLASHAPEGRNVTNGQFQEVREQRDKLRAELAEAREKLSAATMEWGRTNVKADLLAVEVADARRRLLTAAGDDLCRLTPDEIKAMTAGTVQIPPEAEFLASCKRFHAQVAGEVGVMGDCLTLAQLVAENERLRAELAALRAQLDAVSTPADQLARLAALNVLNAIGAYDLADGADNEPCMKHATEIIGATYAPLREQLTDAHLMVEELRGEVERQAEIIRARKDAWAKNHRLLQEARAELERLTAYRLNNSQPGGRE